MSEIKGPSLLDGNQSLDEQPFGTKKRRLLDAGTINESAELFKAIDIAMTSEEFISAFEQWGRVKIEGSTMLYTAAEIAKTMRDVKEGREPATWVTNAGYLKLRHRLVGLLEREGWVNRFSEDAL